MDGSGPVCGDCNCGGGWLSFAANVGSVLGLLVSAWAWIGVYRLRGKYIGELRVGQIRLQLEAEASKLHKYAQGTRPRTDLDEGRTSAAKALVSVRALVGYLPDKNEETVKSAIATLQGIVDLTPLTFEQLDSASRTLAVLLVTVENVIEGWKRS